MLTGSRAVAGLRARVTSVPERQNPSRRQDPPGTAFFVYEAERFSHMLVQAEPFSYVLVQAEAAKSSRQNHFRTCWSPKQSACRIRRGDTILQADLFLYMLVTQAERFLHVSVS